MNGARERRVHGCTVNPLAYYKEFNKVYKETQREPVSLPEAGENGREWERREEEREPPGPSFRGSRRENACVYTLRRALCTSMESGRRKTFLFLQ